MTAETRAPATCASTTPVCSDQCAPGELPQPLALPHRPEAELAVLGAILLDGRAALDKVADMLAIEDFYQPRAAAIYRAMIALAQLDKPIDIITVNAQVGRAGDLELVGTPAVTGHVATSIASGLTGLMQLDRFVTCHNIEAHAKLIHEAALVRRMVIAGREIAEDGMSGVESVDGFLDEAERKVLAVRGAAPEVKAEPEAIVEGRPVPLDSPKGQERVGRILKRHEYLTTKCTGDRAAAAASALNWVLERLELVERELAELRR